MDYSHLWSSNNEDGSYGGYSTILFIKDNHVFQWDFWDNQLHELNGHVRNTLFTWILRKGVLHLDNRRDEVPISNIESLAHLHTLCLFEGVLPYLYLFPSIVTG